MSNLPAELKRQRTLSVNSLSFAYIGSGWKQPKQRIADVPLSGNVYRVRFPAEQEIFPEYPVFKEQCGAPG